jgi:hypothetical protein
VQLCQALLGQRQVPWQQHHSELRNIHLHHRCRWAQFVLSDSDREVRDTQAGAASGAMYSLREFAGNRCTGLKDTIEQPSKQGVLLVTTVKRVVEILREIQVTHLIVFLGAELDERGVNFLIDSTTHVQGEIKKKVDEIQNHRDSKR